MTDNELLLAMSEILDKKLQPIESRTKRIELLLENDILPRIQNIESCYTSTYRRYQSGAEQIDAMKDDIDIMKKVITEHSGMLQKIS
ncbi:MAG TPA: hypothetical protein H9713_00620 [Candidatus Mediterraneibacter surreyensis]|nr:hypothetical protein [Candidatus Mediterraneibacter surreyensis]